MDSITLVAEPFLGGYARDFGETSLVEVTDLSLMSIAEPLHGRAALQKAVQVMWKCALPAPGQTSQSKDKSAQLLCLGLDTFFAIMNDDGSVRDAAQQLAADAYTTDQSDNWVALRLSGPRATAALERICPIDLHPDALPTGAFARTSMEHLGSIVLCEGPDQFLLLSASSSAGSFLHAVETSIIYVS